MSENMKYKGTAETEQLLVSLNVNIIPFLPFFYKLFPCYLDSKICNCNLLI